MDVRSSVSAIYARYQRTLAIQEKANDIRARSGDSLKPLVAT